MFESIAVDNHGKALLVAEAIAKATALSETKELPWPRPSARSRSSGRLACKPCTLLFVSLYRFTTPAWSSLTTVVCLDVGAAVDILINPGYDAQAVANIPYTSSECIFEPNC